MKITCGTDIIEIKRIQEAMESLEGKFAEKIFTNKEREYCESKNKMKYQHYAARFAAKEAIFKAISSVLKDKFEHIWTEVEIINDSMGRPQVHFLDCKISNLKDIDISLSHCREYAVATVVASWEDEKHAI